MALLKESAKKIDLARAINKKPLIIEGDATIEEAVESMREKNESNALVSLTKGNYGILTTDDIIDAKKKKSRAIRASDICRRIKLIPLENKVEIINEIFAKRLPFAAISENNVLVGTISETEINKMYALSRLDTAENK